jgi:dTDP-4-amino-4,6-dideoxygalactose transaminase
LGKKVKFCTNENDHRTESDLIFHFRCKRLENFHTKIRKMQVPLLSLRAQNLNLRDEIMAKFAEVLDSGQFILGSEVEAFEKNTAKYLGVGHAIGVSSGTDALLLALMALEIGRGDEVICPSFSFFGSASCIARLGAKPIFADIGFDDFNISTDDVRKKITKKTRAILPVHLFGQCASIDKIVSIGDEFDLRIIEDCAQSFGALRHGRQSGTFGLVGCFSFFPSKNLGGFGDAGLVCTNDDEIAEKMRILRVHGMKPRYFHRYVGGNFRIDELQAALLNLKLPRVNGYIHNRRKNAEIYLDELFGVKSLTLPRELDGNFHTWNQFTVRVLGGKRDSVLRKLREKGVGCNVYYPLPLDSQECFKRMVGGRKNLTKNAAIASQEVLSLPIYPELDNQQVRWVAKILRDVLADE